MNSNPPSLFGRSLSFSFLFFEYFAENPLTYLADPSKRRRFLFPTTSDSFPFLKTFCTTDDDSIAGYGGNAGRC
jgi:hypothetical protein